MHAWLQEDGTRFVYPKTLTSLYSCGIGKIVLAELRPAKSVNVSIYAESPISERDQCVRTSDIVWTTRSIGEVIWLKLLENRQVGRYLAIATATAIAKRNPLNLTGRTLSGLPGLPG